MDVCRICLDKNVYKDILHLSYDNNMTYADVIMYCLDITIEDCKVTSMICIKCYRKVLRFYRFKVLALESNKFLKVSHQNKIVESDSALQKSITTEDAIIVNMKKELDENEEFIQEYATTEIKIEPKSFCNMKEEGCDYFDDYINSDDEILSVIKLQKNANNNDSNDLNVTENYNKVNKKTKACKKSSKAQVCEECGISVRNLRDHMKQHKPAGDRKMYPCKFCSKTYSSPNGRSKHFRRRHLCIQTKCDICYKEVFDIKRHKQIVHDKNLPFKCSTCERCYINKSLLEIHIRSHTKDRPFTCDTCEKKFATVVLLKSHVKQVHNKERPHMCHVCSKTFFKKYQMQIHIRSHTREKPCKCDQCGKFFSSTSILRKHKLRHTGIKNYHCTLCDMSFYNNGARKTHMISHTKEKRFPCSYCGVKFGRTDHRNRHEMTAHKKNHPTFPTLGSPAVD